jgi:hypothetical protein
MDKITGLVDNREKPMPQFLKDEFDLRKKKIEATKLRRKKLGLDSGSESEFVKEEEQIPEYKGKPKYLATQIKEVLDLRKSMMNKQVNST